MDQRAFAPALWRLTDPDGILKKFDAAEQLAEVSDLCWITPLTGDPGLGADQIRRLRRHTSVFAGVAGGREWQRSTRLVTPIVGGETGTISVASPRYFNEGSTIRITDGFNTELAMVQKITGQSRLVLDRALVNDYEIWDSEVSVLARRPVNLNTASQELIELLLMSLQLRGRNERVNATEAKALAELIVESRPLTGHEDLLRRILLPAADLEELPKDAEVIPDVFANGSGGFISAIDAFAIYANALNANDLTLSFSTMPFCYSSRDTYRLSLRSSVNAKSGVERATSRREEVMHVVPQRELISIWTLQEQFDESLRLDREAPYWLTGPQATSRYDSDNIPPSRLWPHMGSANGQRFLPGVIATPNQQNSAEPPTPEHVFADREEQGYVQLAPHRLEDTDRIQGRALHFDQESRNPEGRYLPDEVVRYSADDMRVQWTGQNDVLCRPLSLSFWIQPRSLENATLLDLAGANTTGVDRVSVLIEDGFLILRVSDAVGDHTATNAVEVGELRYSTAQGDGPGLPVDTWSHISIDVRGNRADQMTMLVNGLEFGVTSPGYSQLTGAGTQGSALISIESLDGFRPQGCLRIGDELIEYNLDQNGQISTLRNEFGRLAGFGGRNARVRYTHDHPDEFPSSLPVNIGIATLTHAGDTPVELYGYSLDVVTGVPAGGSITAEDLGVFRVARMIGVEDGETPDGDMIDGQSYNLDGSPTALPLGRGLDASSGATGILLGSADTPGQVDPLVMEAFNRDGGYAVILQRIPWLRGDVAEEHVTVEQAPLGGIEIIRYSGWQGNVLQIAARGDAVGELANYPNQSGGANSSGGARAFVTMWREDLELDSIPVQRVATLSSQSAYVIPISVSAPGASGTSFLQPINGAPEFAQFTEVDLAENTEWVRYDSVVPAHGQLVRDAPDAMLALFFLLARAAPGNINLPIPPDGGGNGGGDGGGGDGAKLLIEPQPVIAAPTLKRAAQSAGGPVWLPDIGAEELIDFPVSRAVSDALQFRGVMGTYSHRHSAGIDLLPVFKVQDRGPDRGQPGRLDPVFLVDGSTPFDDPGMEALIHWCYRPGPLGRPVHDWVQNDLTVLSAAAAPGPPILAGDTLVDYNVVYVALQERLFAPLNFVPPVANIPQPADSRRNSRLISFPSGEMPRVVTETTVGSNTDGSLVPSAVIDEVVFGDTMGVDASPVYELADTRAAAAMLGEDLTPAAAPTIRIHQKRFRTSLDAFETGADVLDSWPTDAGLIRIGREILCYSNVDPGSGTMTIAQGGRGLLGTQDQYHERNAPVYLLEHFDVSVLAAGIGAEDAAIPIQDASDFPDEGTLLIDQELIHYTRKRGQVLEMPRLSEEPGAKDNGGGGMFRGRFGTPEAGHTFGTPVISFPFRYWDRWEEEAEGPELSYFGFSRDELSAVWKEMFMLNDETSFGGSRLGVLVRTDPNIPWDSNPDETPGLTELFPADLRENWAPIGAQSDRIEWRVFVDYTSGAFDATTGQSHGWKQTPRLNALGVRFIAPNVKLRSVED